MNHSFKNQLTQRKVFICKWQFPNVILWKFSHFLILFNCWIDRHKSNSSQKFKEYLKYILGVETNLKAFLTRFSIPPLGSIEIISIRNICNMIFSFSLLLLPLTSVWRKERFPWKIHKSIDGMTLTFSFVPLLPFEESFWPKRRERKHPLPSYWQRFLLARQWRWWNLVRIDVGSLIFNKREKGRNFTS